MQVSFQALIVLVLACLVSCEFILERAEDSEVAICEKYDVCNVVHNHYWEGNSVEKLCKCPEGFACGATFSRNDSYSMAVNYRTQMKFCSPVSDLKSQMDVCEEDEIAIQIKYLYYVDKVKNVTATVLCNCETEEPNYWKYHSRDVRANGADDKLSEYIDNFKCSELYECKENEFCGFARLDYGFLYQRCSCDTAHECKYIIESGEVEEDVESEIFYKGLVLKSRCVQKSDYENW